MGVAFHSLRIFGPIDVLNFFHPIHLLGPVCLLFFPKFQPRTLSGPVRLLGTLEYILLDGFIQQYIC